MCIRGRQSGGELDAEMLKRLAFMNELAGHEAVLTGGEPTLHTQFAELVDTFCAKAKTVSITTNGTNTSALAALPKRENLRFQVSLDGDEGTHDSIRDTGTFERAMRTLHTLDGQGRNYTVASTVSKRNSHSMKGLAHTLKALKHMSYWRVSYEMPFSDDVADFMLGASEWNSFVDELLECCEVRLKIKKLFPFELYDRHFDELGAKGVRCVNCGGGRAKIYVYPDLSVYPCTCLTDFCVGSLKTSTLGEILSSDLIKPFTDYHVRDGSVCAGCKYKQFCNGGCIGMSYHYFGRLGAGDIRCPYVRECFIST